MRLTFVRESVERGCARPTRRPRACSRSRSAIVLTGAKMDIQPLAGDDFQSLLTVLPSVIRGPEGPLARQGRRADHRRASDEQRQPQRSVHRRFRSRVAQRRRGIGRGAVESVRRRVRALLDQRHAGAHQARHATTGSSSRTTSCPGFGKGFAFVNKFEPRLSISGPLKRDKLLLRPVPAVPLRAHRR